jgi:hypothetical protein
MGMIMGSGQVSLLSGQTCLTGRVRLRHVDFALASHGTAVPPAGPRRPPARCPAGPRRIRPEADFQLRNSFSFSNLFYKLQINLNLNKS